MKVSMQFPAAAEPHATVMDVKDNTVVIEPRFFTNGAPVVLSRVLIRGDKGSERLFMLLVSPTTGEPRLVPVDEQVTATFDTLTPEEFKKKKKAKEIHGRKANQARQDREQPAPPAPPH